MRAIIIYDSWYGDTRRVAEEIGRGLAEATGEDPAVVEVGEAAVEGVRRCDLVVIGTPNHFGRATRKTRELLRVLKESGATNARFAAFDTCFEADTGKASGELARLAQLLVAPTAPVPPTLSTVVDATRGPLRAGELERARRFGAELARALGPSVPVVA